MTPRTVNVIAWFGVLGGFTAWAVQFVANLAFTFAQCNQPIMRWHLPIHDWEIGLGSAGIAIGLAAEAAAMWTFLQTRGVDDAAAPPPGRLRFLAVVGLTVNFMALAIMTLTTIGIPLQQVCRQS